MNDKIDDGTDMIGGFGWLGMGLMWLWALLPVALVIRAGWLVARGAGSSDGQRKGADADAILRQRVQIRVSAPLPTR